MRIGGSWTVARFFWHFLINLAIGNGDAHSKNYSILLGDRGQVTLAPLYDAAPVMYLDPRFKNTGHVINGRTNIDWVDLDDLVAEATSWGTAAGRARGTVEDVVGRVWDAAHAVDLPLGTDGVRGRMDELWRRRNWLTRAGWSGGSQRAGSRTTKHDPCGRFGS